MSTTATGLPASVAAYLAALRAELSDLAPEERDDLLAEVEPSLLEAAAGGDEPIAGRLGAPADFAADLRARRPARAPARRRGVGAAPGLPRFGSVGGTALVLAAALAGSFALGLRSRGATDGRRAALVAADLVLLVAAVPVLDRATDAPVPVIVTGTVPAETPGFAYQGVAVENVYPYDRRGRLLHDVRLCDQLGAAARGA